MDWKTYAWLKRGKRRKQTLSLFSSNFPLSTTDIKKKLKVAMSQASFSLKELQQKHLVKCLNPEDKIGRLYKTTSQGTKLLKEGQND